MDERFHPHDVIVLPFPYTDNIARSKRRPAVVLSDKDFNDATGQLVCAMITTAKRPWPLDIAIADGQAAGLRVQCRIRMKLFTLDKRFVLRKCGRLATKDRRALTHALSQLLTL